MFASQGSKTMIDLHGLTVKEVKKLLEDYFAKIEEYNLGEFYLITGRGSHVNSNGSRGVLKKILPKLLKPYCQDIVQINQETGAYKIILKPRQELSSLKVLLSKLLTDEREQIKYAQFLKQEAEKNDIEAILALATVHLHQAIKGVDNINEGTALLLKAKQLGSLEADVQLGILYHEGLIIKQNHEKAFKHFYYAANKGHPVAQYYVAVCYLHGKGVKYNDEQAVNWMKKSADQGDVYAQTTLGDFYLLGKITQQDNEQGIHYKTKAAEQGLADAQIDLARCYATGYGVKKDYKIAFKWYLSAAQFNKAYAVYQVGSYLLDGRSGLAPNPGEAFDWFLKAAELGDADGQAQVAYQYLFGKVGVKPDIEKGLAWALKAVDQKNQYGYYVMATAHLQGIGVEQNTSKAYSFMKQAAEAGHSQAQYELGLLLIGKEPTDIPCDFDAGIQWLEKAAAQNHFEACQILQDLFKKTESTELATKSSFSSNFFKLKSESKASKEKASKELESSNSEYYKLGELACLLLINAWYMTSEEDQNFFRKKYVNLYNKFVERVNHLVGAELPERKAEERPLDHVSSCLNNISKKMGEKSILAIHFNMGFKMMAVKMMKFTEDEVVVKELLDYLQSVGIDAQFINRIENVLNKQISNPSKDFSSKFELLETELKNQLSLISSANETQETSHTELNNNFALTDTVSSYLHLENSPNNHNRYSMWHKGIAIGLTAVAVGVAIANPEKAKEVVKTNCFIQ